MGSLNHPSFILFSWQDSLGDVTVHPSKRLSGVWSSISHVESAKDLLYTTVVVIWPLWMFVKQLGITCDIFAYPTNKI